MRFVVTFILTLCASLVSAQEVPEFGQVSLEDFATTPFDSTSSSVILFDKATYVGGYQPRLEHHIRVKVNTKDAVETWGEFRVGWYTTKVKAATYFVEDGKIVSDFVEKDAIIKDLKSGRKKIVVLNNIRAGCILELSFRSDIAYFGIPFWFIQHDQPVLWSEYVLMSSFKSTYVIYGGVEPYIFDKKYKGQYYRWVFRSVPPFVPEPLMPDPVTYFARIEFWERADTWANVNKDYLANYETWYYNREQRFTKRKVKVQVDSIADPLEKVKFLSAYIKRNYRWSGDDTFEPRYSSLFDTGEGSSGDLNILLYAMLSWTGFKPEFVLISTRGNGLAQKELPSLSQFNYVLCRLVLNGKEYLLDATNPDVPFNILPARCLTFDGFRVSKDGGQWITISPPVRDQIKATAWVSLSKDNTLNGSCNLASRGYPAIEENSFYETLGETEYKKERILNKMWSIDSMRVTQNSHDPLSFRATYFGSADNNVSVAGEKMLIDPFVVSIMKGNDLAAHTRVFPIDLVRPIEKTMMCYLSIPAGYTVESLPASEALSLPDKSITASLKVLNDGKTIVVIFVLDVNKTWFEPVQYGNIKAFFERVIAKENEMIVLVKT